MWPGEDDQKQAIAALVGLRFWKWIFGLFVLALAVEHIEVALFLIVSVVAIFAEAWRRARKGDAEKREAEIEAVERQARQSSASDFLLSQQIKEASISRNGPMRSFEPPTLAPGDPALALSDDAYGAAGARMLTTEPPCLYCSSTRHVSYDHTATCPACGNAFHTLAQHADIVAAGKPPELTSWRDKCFRCGSFAHTDGEHATVGHR